MICHTDPGFGFSLSLLGILIDYSCGFGCNLGYGFSHGEANVIQVNDSAHALTPWDYFCTAFLYDLFLHSDSIYSSSPQPCNHEPSGHQYRN